MEEVVHVHGVAGGRVMLGHNPDIDVDHFCVHNSIPEYCKHAAQVLLNVTSKDTEKNVLRLSEIITQKCAGITDIYSKIPAIDILATTTDFLTPYIADYIQSKNGWVNLPAFNPNCSLLHTLRQRNKD